MVSNGSCTRAAVLAPLDLSWLDVWQIHSGTLPGHDGNWPGWGARTWSVTANVNGNGNRTASGDAWCGTSNSIAPDAHSSSMAAGHCWCRMTGPVAGLWIHRIDWGSGAECSPNCATNCAQCVVDGSGGNCTRAAILN
jgi:hypothetical protein